MDVPPFSSVSDPDAAVASLAAKTPWSFGSALEYYQNEDEENVSANMVRTIFAMDLKKANALLSIRMLLELLFNNTRCQAYSSGMEQFQIRHPDLFAAFQLQVSLHENVFDAEKYAPACIDSWNHAIHGKAVDSVPLPDLGFEGP